MKIDRKGGEREGERHAAKVVMNGTRTRDTLSGRSLLCGMRLDHLASGRPLCYIYFKTIVALERDESVTVVGMTTYNREYIGRGEQQHSDITTPAWWGKL